MNSHSIDAGYTLVELMITIAVISILTAIAVPLYSGYIREGHFATIRADMHGLRTAMEDYRLENTSYIGATADPGIATILTDLNNSNYAFTVSLGTGSYDVLGSFSSTIWVRCEDRMNRCCDADTGGGAASTDCNFP